MALKKELDSSNDWKTITSLFNALSIFNDVETALNIMETYIIPSRDFDITLTAAAKAYIRMKRDNVNDVVPLLDILRLKKYSSSEGALEVLGYDQVKPCKDDQRIILEKCFNFGHNRPRGYTDPRYGLAAASYSWDYELKESFLKNCMESNDQPLIYVAKKSLMNEKANLR
jgi:hypothetical protein